MRNFESSYWFRKWVHWPFAESLEKRKREIQSPGASISQELSALHFAFRNEIVMVALRKFYRLVCQTFLFWLMACNWLIEWDGLSQGQKKATLLFFYSFSPLFFQTSSVKSFFSIFGWNLGRDPSFSGHVQVLKSSILSNTKILCYHLIQIFYHAPSPPLSPELSLQAPHRKGQGGFVRHGGSRGVLSS